MEKRISNIIIFLFLIFVSCEQKKDSIEIYKTKNRIESYDGIALRDAIKDSVIINQIIESYKEEIRIDTLYLINDLVNPEIGFNLVPNHL